MSERLACRVVKQPRGTQRYPADAAGRPRHAHPGHRHPGQPIWVDMGIAGSALLQRAGWQVGKDREERIWRREGLKVAKKQKPRGRLWIIDGSCVRLRPEHANHVWSYDFVSAKTHDGRTVRRLNLIDKHRRESLLVRPERRWSGAKVIEGLADVMVIKGVPEHIRSDNGPEFVAKDLRKWMADTGARTLCIEPGRPWENGYCESFNWKLGGEFLNGEIFYSLKGGAGPGRTLAHPLQTPPGHTSRPATDRQHRRHGTPRSNQGLEKWKAKYASHFPTPSTAARYIQNALRYTNCPTGTKDRADHISLVRIFQNRRVG
jgi:putative transposase